MKPNIIFLFPDQWRGDWFSTSKIGKMLNIPTLNSLADNGVKFNNAFTPSPLCAPARACIATGMEYPAYGVVNNSMDLPAEAATVYHKLRDNGYHVMGCGKFDLHKASYSWGKDGGHLMKKWGFSDGIDNEGKVDGVTSYKQNKVGPYMDFLKQQDKVETHIKDFDKRGKYGTFPTELNDDEYCDNWVTNNAIKLIDRAPKKKPLFLQVNFTGPHDPFDITDKMSTWYKDVEFPKPFGEFNPDINHNNIRQNYAAMMENIDNNVKKILDHPRIKDELDNTIIVFSSDHGDMLGDHGVYEKHLPYNGSTHVPMFISGKDISKGQNIEAPISILDLPGTFLELSGTSKEVLHNSYSLMPLINSGKVNRKIIKSALFVDNIPKRQWRMSVNDKFKYIQWFDGREALYALNDYKELNNIINNFPEVAYELQKYIGGFITTNNS
ncbi:MAG: sulfatase-like hydrolase/transferase [Spirochaetaceae bacterium]